MDTASFSGCRLPVVPPSVRLDPRGHFQVSSDSPAVVFSDERLSSREGMGRRLGEAAASLHSVPTVFVTVSLGYFVVKVETLSICLLSFLNLKIFLEVPYEI